MRSNGIYVLSGGEALVKSHLCSPTFKGGDGCAWRPDDVVWRFVAKSVTKSTRVRPWPLCRTRIWRDIKTRKISLASPGPVADSRRIPAQLVRKPFGSRGPRPMGQRKPLPRLYPSFRSDVVRSPRHGERKQASDGRYETENVIRSPALWFYTW